MTAFIRSRVKRYVKVGMSGATTAAQGRALEDLICYVFEQVPGIAVSRRNQKNPFSTEEIDVALWNDGHPDGFFFLSDIILVEWKNWSRRISSSEVSWFSEKLRHRGLDFGILVHRRASPGTETSLGRPTVLWPVP
jgi:hypothetical protein